MAVEFGLLGGVEAHLDGARVDVGHPKQRGVLAVLLVEANRPVSTGQLLDRVWGEDPPVRGRETLYNYVSRLRAALPAAGDVRLTRRSGGYQLTLDEQTVDLHRFHHLLTQARATGGRQALELFDHALALWRGEPLPDLDTPWATELRATWERERFAAELDHTDLALRCGRHAELLPGLTSRAARHPLDERIAAHLMLALYRNGRQADALQHYQHVRTRLADDLGTDPGPQLRRLHERILQADPELAVPADAEPESVASSPVPRQLPAAPRSFTGRGSELAGLTAVLDAAPADQGAAVVISAIGGAGGIGKTWLALHWAYQHLARFPDGQLFVDLRGFSPDSRPLSTEAALRGFLDALGVPPHQIPPDPHTQAARYRGLVADKRMLIILDNAADTEQVTPLLPGTPTCTVVVTSRRHLTGLITRHDAHHLPLDVLSDAEARALLTARLGTARLAAEPDAVDEILACCGGFTLALSIVAGRAHTNPRLPLASLAAELRDAGLHALDETDPTASLPTVLSWSYRNLTPEQARAFGLLGIAPGADLGLPAAASLIGLPLAETRTVLRGLQEASLLDQDIAGRYRMHDLIRHYAATVAHDDAALHRLFDFYVQTAYAADRLLAPGRTPITIGPPLPGCHPWPLTDVARARAWQETEHTNLVAAHRLAAEQEWPAATWQLTWTLTNLHNARGDRSADLAVCRAGLLAAQRLDEPVVLMRAHRLLGRACSQTGRHAEAVDHLGRSLDLATALNETAEQASTHNMLAWAWSQQGDDENALRHATRALELYRTGAAPLRHADAHNQVGWYSAQLGHLDEARSHCEQALALFQQHGDPSGEADTLDSLGYVAHLAGDYREAVARYQEALKLCREVNAANHEVNTLRHLGEAYAALGQPDPARAIWSEALKLYREQGRATDAERVQRQLDDLVPAPESSRPSDAGKTTQNA